MNFITQRDILKNKRDLYIKELETCDNKLYEKVLIKYKNLLDEKISNLDKEEEKLRLLTQEREIKILKILYQLEDFLENKHITSCDRNILNDIISNNVEFSVFESLCDFLNSIIIDSNIKMHNGIITYIELKPYLKKCFTLEKEFIFKSDLQFEGHNIYIYLSSNDKFKCNIDKRIINNDIYYSMATLPIENDYDSPIETSINTPPEIDKIIDDEYKKLEYNKPTEEYGFVRKFIKKIFKL